MPPEVEQIEPEPEAPTQKATDDPIAVARAIADSIKSAMATHQAPAPEPTPKPDPSEALTKEAAEVNRRFDELMNEGKFAEAMSVRDTFSAKVARTLQGNPEDDTNYKVAFSLAERNAKHEHSDVFKRWGGEIKAAINKLPPNERVLPDAWDRAVQAVKTNHFDELLNEQRAALEEEYKQKFITAPQGGSGRPGRSSEETYGLSAEQLEAADILGIDAKDYAEAKKLEEVRPPGQFEGFYIMPPTKAVEPGRF